MSSWCNSQLRVSAKLSTVRIVAGLTTGLKVSWQSTPNSWDFPLTTNLALYRSRDPSERYLCRNSQWHRIIFASCGLGTSSQVFYLSKALYSVSMTSFQFLSSRASFGFVGMGEMSWVWKEYLGLGLKIPLLALVCIVWAVRGEDGGVRKSDGGETTIWGLVGRLEISDDGLKWWAGSYVEWVGRLLASEVAVGGARWRWHRRVW